MGKLQDGRVTGVYPIFRPLAEVRLLKPRFNSDWLAKNALLPLRLASRFPNRHSMKRSVVFSLCFPVQYRVSNPNERRRPHVDDSTIAFRAKEQLGKFLGKVFTHFSKPRKKFLADMLYGIQASGDTQLSSVMRAINDDSGKCHAVEKRLSRNVADATIGDDIDKAILEAGAKFVRDDTLILVDPTEIRKEFGLKMEHVRNATSRSSSGDARETADAPREGTAHGRRQGLRRGADDAAHVASRQRVVRVDVADRRGMSHAERLQRGPRVAKPSVAVAERLLTAIGVNRHADKPQIRNNVHYRYENASHPFNPTFHVRLDGEPFSRCNAA